MDATDRMERLLALILLQQMKGSSHRDKVLQLSIAGFTNTEIADLLHTRSVAIAQLLYKARREVTRSTSGKGR